MAENTSKPEDSIFRLPKPRALVMRHFDAVILDNKSRPVALRLVSNTGKQYALTIVEADDGNGGTVPELKLQEIFKPCAD